MTNPYLDALVQELRAVTAPPQPLYADFFNIFHYHLGWTDEYGKPAQADTGKRIRPLLCLWTCEAANGNWHNALPAAAAVELIHNFSLMHDDIQDDSAERRGRTTVWKIWGLAQGINAGDAMFVLAHLALNRLTNTDLELARYVEIQRVLDNATFKLTQGQYLDIGFERADQVTLEHYFEMVRGKTAALLSATCEIGARIATTDAQVIRAFAAYGENLGIAFQISDDVLGLWGDPALTGKSAHTDLHSRKKSYPVLAAMSASTELRALYARAEWTDQDIQRVQDILRSTNAREMAIEQAETYAARALESLRQTNLENDAIFRLSELVTQIVHREK